MKITLNPIKEVFINYLVKMDIETITKDRAIAEQSLKWCNGYLITVYEDDQECIVEKKSREFNI